MVLDRYTLPPFREVRMYQDRAVLRRPKDESKGDIIMSWSIVSNAADKSRSNKTDSLSSSSAVRMSFTMLNTAVSEPCLVR